MGIGRYRVTWSVLAVILWVLIPAGIAMIGILMGREIETDVGMTRIIEIVSSGIRYSMLISIAVLVVFALVFRWNDLGFNRPQPWKSLWLLWFPALYLALFFAAGFAVGLPAGPTLSILFVNMLLVGISEELAFRGVLLQSLRVRFGMWPAVIVSSLLFGAAHMANALATGDLLAATAQALSAVITGTLFAAVVIRTGSILPAMVLHALWDFGLLIAATGAINAETATGSGASAAAAGSAAGTAAGDSVAAVMPEISPLLYFVPVLFNVPNLIYALYVLRRRRTAELRAPLQVEAATVGQS